MKSKRAEEFINGHIKIGNLQFTAADIEYCVMLAEQEAEEEIEALKAGAVRAFLMACSCGRDICSYRAEGVGCTDYLRGHGCSQYSVFIQKLNEQ